MNMDPSKTDEEVTRFIQDSGLAGTIGPEDIRNLGDGGYMMVLPVDQGWLLQHGALDDLVGYFDRWIFASKDKARMEMNKTPAPFPMGYEPDGWILHPLTGRTEP